MTCSLEGQLEERKQTRTNRQVQHADQNVGTCNFHDFKCMQALIGVYVVDQADEERAVKFPNLTTPHTLKALQA